jgi:hypothetical protein
MTFGAIDMAWRAEIGAGKSVAIVLQSWGVFSGSRITIDMTAPEHRQA